MAADGKLVTVHRADDKVNLVIELSRTMVDEMTALLAAGDGDEGDDYYYTLSLSPGRAREVSADLLATASQIMIETGTYS